MSTCNLNTPKAKEVINNYTKQYIDFGFSKVQATKLAKTALEKQLIESTSLEEALNLLGSTEAILNQDPAAVFMDETVSKDTMNTIFDSLAQHGPVQASQEHSQHLRGILNSLVAPVLEKAQEFSLKLSREGKEAMGQISGKDIKMVTGIDPIFNGIHLSLQEIYTHELLHGITEEALDKSSVLRNAVEKLYLHVRKSGQITADDFRARNSDGSYKVVVDEAAEIKAAEARFNYIFSPRTNPNALFEFVAFGLSNEHLIKKIKAIPYREPTAAPTTIYERLANVFQQIAEFIGNRFLRLGSNPSSYDALYALTLKLSSYNDKASVYTAALSKGLTHTNKFLAEHIYKGFEKFRDVKGDGIFSRFIRTVGGIPTNEMAEKFDTFISDMRAITAEQNSTYTKVLSELILSLPKEATVFTDKWVTGFRNLLIAKRANIDRRRNHVEQATIKTLNEAFTTGLTEGDKQNLFYVLRGDLADLGIPLDELKDILNSDTKLDSLINRYVNKLSVYGKNKNNYNLQAKNLGEFMVSEVSALQSQMLNPYNIANGKYSGKFTAVGNLTRAEEDINVLKSLYAIKYMPTKVRTGIANKIDAELKANVTDNGFTVLMSIHSKFKEDSLANLFDGNKTQMISGWTFDITDPNIDAQIVDRSNTSTIALLRKSKYAEYPLNNGRIMFISNSNGLLGYNQGILSLTSTKVKGTSYITALQDKGLSYKDAKDAFERMRNSVLNGKVVEELDNDLIPVLNPNGDIVDFRYIMNANNKNELLKRDTRFDVVFGQMQANYYDKIYSETNNKNLAAMLHTHYREEYAKHPKHFVSINNDPEYQDRFKLMPYRMQKTLIGLFGRHQDIWVHRDAVDTVLGYRQAALANLFTDPNIKRIGNMIEKILKEVVGIAKHNIVIKTSVLAFNIMSNTLVLVSHGVPLDTVIKGQIKAAYDINDYISKSRDIAKIDVRLKATNSPAVQADLENRRKLLAERLKRHPSHELVSYGFINSIVEDVDLEEATNRFTLSGKFSKAIEDTEYIPEIGKDVWGYLYLTKRNPVYKLLMAGTRFSDFTARQVLYNHLVSTGTDPQLARAEIRRTFVDYEYPTSRPLQWLNDVGLAIFTKYAIRSQMVIYRLFFNQPGSIAALYTAEGMLNMNLPDITDSWALLPGLDNPVDVILSGAGLHGLNIGLSGLEVMV